MHLLSRLNLLLPPADEPKEPLPAAAENSVCSGIRPLDQLLEWNQSLETHFPVTTTSSTLVGHASTLQDQLPSLSKHILRTMVQALSRRPSSALSDLLVQPIDDDDDTAECCPSTTESIEAAILYWKEKQHGEGLATASGDSAACKLILRTAQNWLRYYIQAILAQHALPSSSSASSCGDNNNHDLGIVADWNHPPQLLELYVVLMEYPHAAADAICTKYASQLLFFATFPHPLPYYKSYLVDTHQLCQRLLALLVRNYDNTNDTVSIWLSLLRNVHNALAGYHCKAAVEAASMVLLPEPCSWLVRSDDDDGVPARVVTYATVLRDLSLHVLSGDDETETEVQSGANKKLRTELVIELLRCCYVLKIPDIHSDNQWRKLIDLLWQQESIDIRITTAAILTEVPTSFCEHVPPLPLLHILQESAAHQASLHIVDDRSAAAITPLLILLYKYCADDHASYCTHVRHHLFPNPLPVDTPQRARNSRPLDTPPGTLRYSIVHGLFSNSLLQGHAVKRLIGEVLWMVCNKDRNEFIRRVGMGNALPLLSSKGLVATMPATSSMSSVQQQ